MWQQMDMLQTVRKIWKYVHTNVTENLTNQTCAQACDGRWENPMKCERKYDKKCENHMKCHNNVHKMLTSSTNGPGPGPWFRARAIKMLFDNIQRPFDSFQRYSTILKRCWKLFKCYSTLFDPIPMLFDDIWWNNGTPLTWCAGVLVRATYTRWYGP